MTLSYSTTKISSSYKRIMWIWGIVFSTFFVAWIVSIIIDLGVLTTIFSIPLFIIMLMPFLLIHKLKRYEKTGLIKFYEDSLTIDHANYSLEIISRISIIYKAFEGQRSSVTLFGIYEGDNNELTIELKDGSIVYRKFLSKSKYDYRFLADLTDKYKKRDIAVELVKGSPTIDSPHNIGG